MITVVFVLAIAALAAAYVGYGAYLRKVFDVNNQHETPAHALRDGVDYVPAPAPVLFGHHFSSIAGAGPVLGPIIAGSAFGWLPVWLWIIGGAILIGGVHDFSSLVISLRNQGKSIAEIAKTFMSVRAYRLLLVFIWLTLVYVLAVFTDLTSATFIADGGVASSSMIFILLAVGFGISLYRFHLPLGAATAVFVPLLFFSVWLGQQLPLNTVPAIGGSMAKTWNLVLLGYCFIASVTPVWVLLQPRDYLSSFLLYSSIIGGAAGILCGGFSVAYPAFVGWNAPGTGPLMPLLFVTVACGAVSGFHAIVAGGTSSKQLSSEAHALPIGYGAMLVEAVVAVIALCTIMLLEPGDPLTKKAPLAVYGAGMAKFLSLFGMPAQYGNAFGILALSTFILTTLDTATRLARYIFQELFNLPYKSTRYAATAATLVLPAIFVLMTVTDATGAIVPAWKSIWPVFGATNQLLAGVALLVIAVWLKKMHKPVWFVVAPMVFMLLMAIWALISIMVQYAVGIIGIIGGILVILAVFLVIEAVKIFTAEKLALPQ